MKTTIDFPGLSLNEVRAQFPDCFYSQSWYASEAFANEKVPAGKWEVSLEVVKDSFRKTWDEQQKLTEGGCVVPPAAVLAYAICKHFKDTGERTFTDYYARTSSLDSDGDRVYEITNRYCIGPRIWNYEWHIMANGYRAARNCFFDNYGDSYWRSSSNSLWLLMA